MLYFKALREGLSALPPADPATRQVIDQLAHVSGWGAMHKELQRIDPVTADRIEPGDAQRIQRALEVYYLSGEPMSRLLAIGRNRQALAPMLAIALEPSDRAVLHMRIERRFGQMLESGLTAEVQRLRETFSLSASLPSMRAVGYRQVWQYLEGGLTVAGLREAAVAATRQLAKRQLTWLRAMHDVQRFDCVSNHLDTRVEQFLSTRLSAR
jgi:tRNA dimethylallyltransferase